MVRIFVSHIHEEGAIAQVLKDWVGSSFSGQCTVFVSSDRDDLPPGSKWLSEIDEALESARVFLVLCSPMSLHRSWINFETGCAWIKRVPIIPICHSGQSISHLPQPIATFQALEIDSSDFPMNLLKGIAKHLDISQVPRIDTTQMAVEIKKALGSTAGISQGTGQRHVESNDLPQSCVDIMNTIANVAGRPCPAEELSRHLNLRNEQLRYYLDILLEKEMLYDDINADPVTYALDKAGRKYLHDAELL